VLGLTVALAALLASPTRVDAHPDQTTATRVQPPTGVSRVVPAPTSLPPPEPRSDATLVADPRVGDLRADPSADTLPTDYVAAPARLVWRDVPYGPDPAHRIDLHLPTEADTGAVPVIVYLHHGGWISGDRAEVPDMVLRFLERGFAVASVGYRLAPEHPFPAPMDDVVRAVRELKVLGTETGLLDPDALVLYGISAGAHLAASVGADPDAFEPTDLSPEQAAVDARVAAVVSISGPTDLVAMYDHPHDWAAPMSGAHAGCDPCTPSDLVAPSLSLEGAEGLPPSYWVYGGDDPLVDAETQGRVAADAWADAAATPGSVWFDLVDAGDHVLGAHEINQRALERFVDGVAA
jgi:acetyl esterase/lipase